MGREESGSSVAALQKPGAGGRRRAF